jgi:hypothetical protein
MQELRNRRLPALVVVLLTVLVVVALVFGTRAEAFVYWSDFSIGRANPDGSGIDDEFIRTGRGQICGLATDATHIYWTSRGARTNTIGRANLDGSGARRSFITGANDPSGVAVDQHHIYWANYDAIGRADLDGTDVDQSFITTGAYVAAVAVDAHHVYWAGVDAIGRANLDGGAVDPDFITAADFAFGVAVDPMHIYWPSWPGGPHRNTIGRADLDGADAEPGFISGGLYGPGSVAVDSSHLYWGDFFGETIGRANLDGTGVQRAFIRPFLTQVCAVAVDGLRSFSLGAAERDTEHGTAELAAKVPAAGELAVAATSRVNATTKAAAAAGVVRLAITPTERAREELEKNGSALVTARITYTPDSTDPDIVAGTLTKRLRLIER